MLLRSFVYVKVSVGSLTAQAAGSPGSVTIPCAGLDHPRTLMGNFHEIERALKEALHQLGTREMVQASAYHADPFAAESRRRLYER